MIFDQGGPCRAGWLPNCPEALDCYSKYAFGKPGSRPEMIDLIACFTVCLPGFFNPPDVPGAGVADILGEIRRFRAGLGA